MTRIDRSGLAVVLAGVLGTAGSAWAAASNFTTLNSSVMTLLSFDSTPLSPTVSGSYTGPSNNLPFWSAQTWVGPTNLYGTAAWFIESDSATEDLLGGQFVVDSSFSGSGAQFHIELLLNVTFSNRVELNLVWLPGTLTFTPTGGTPSTLSLGTQLAAGTYDLVWNLDVTTTQSNANQALRFLSVASPVPSAGVAAIAACGVGGVLRRRRR